MNYFGFFLTLTLFLIFYKFKLFIKIPIIISVGLLIILILKLFKIDYFTYNLSAKYLTYFIAPSTLAFSYPLYKNSNILIKNKRILYSTLLIGATSAIISTYLLLKLFQVDLKIILSMVEKSTTMPIAIEISKNVGGYPELTSALVLLTGILGGVFGHFVLNKLKIKNNIAIGLALGSASHVIGTASCANKKKYTQVAAATIALILVGFITAVLIPLLQLCL